MRQWLGANWKRVLLVVAALVVINAPFLLHAWQGHRARTEGVQVSATVAGVTRSGDNAVVAFRLPRTLDPARELRSVKVEGAVGAQAARTGELDVRVLRGHPAAFYVEGQVRSPGGLIITLSADLLVLVMLLLAWRLGGRIRRPALEAIAVTDVESGDEGSVLDKQDDGTYLINGEVAEARAQSLVLRLRDRDVTIHLRDHHNPLAVGDRAQVRALLVG